MGWRIRLFGSPCEQRFIRNQKKNVNHYEKHLLQEDDYSLDSDNCKECLFECKGESNMDLDGVVLSFFLKKPTMLAKAVNI